MQLVILLLLGILVLVGCDRIDKGESQEPVPPLISHADITAQHTRHLRNASTINTAPSMDDDTGTLFSSKPSISIRYFS